MTEPLAQNEPRDTYIMRHMTEALEEVGIGIGVVSSAETWNTIPLPPARFGWTEPVAMRDEETGGVFPMALICPEIIAKVTEKLSDTELDAYLDVVEIKIIAADGQPSLLSELFDRAPNSVALWNDTDARALDLGIVPTG